MRIPFSRYAIFAVAIGNPVPRFIQQPQSASQRNDHTRGGLTCLIHATARPAVSLPGWIEELTFQTRKLCTFCQLSLRTVTATQSSCFPFQSKMSEEPRGACAIRIDVCGTHETFGYLESSMPYIPSKLKTTRTFQ